MRIATLIRSALVVFLTTGCTCVSSIAITLPSPGTAANVGPFGAGWEFTLSGAFIVTELGFNDESGSRLTDDHDVGI
jgi:hypothetical protein